MRNIIIYIFFLSLSISYLNAQNTDHKNAVGYKLFVSDYLSLDKQYRQEVFARDSSYRFFHPDDVNFGAELSYNRYLNSSLNISVPFRVGSVDAYHLRIDSTDGNCIGEPCNKRYFSNELFMSTNLAATYKFNNGYILKEDFFLAPFIQTGFNAVYFSKREKHFDIQIPAAVGLNVRLNHDLSLQTQMDFNYSLISQKHNFIVSAGIIWSIGKKITNKEEESVETTIEVGKDE